MGKQKKTTLEIIDRLNATLVLDQPVTCIPLVNNSRAQALAKMNIFTVRDLLSNYPRRYIDLSRVCKVASAPIGELCTVTGNVHKIQLKRPKPKLFLVEISLVDDTGVLIITAFRQPWLIDNIKVGDYIAAAGKVEFNYGFKRMTNPYLEVLEKREVQGKIIPVHPAMEKISPAWMRRLIRNALDLALGQYDVLPLDLRCKYHFMSKQNALCAIHFPRKMDEPDEARRRLVYEELFLLELFLMQEGAARSAGMMPHAHRIDGGYLQLLQDIIPFELTDEQLHARDELLAVIEAPTVANHMILGDVGTGKTIVCAHALAAAADNGWQAALLAPTEVLARQHGESLGELLGKVGMTTAVLTGATSQSERADILSRLVQGDIDVLIGTHAILEDDVVFRDLSIAIVDEQQRFGVAQRAKLLSKGEAPDAIYLTATPIPRTLALALYGNLTLSYLKHRPYTDASRVTQVLEKKDRGRALDAAREALERGEQVYIVCPLVGIGSNDRDKKAASFEMSGFYSDDEKEASYPVISIESDDDFGEENIAAATKEAAHLRSKVFFDYEVELLHGGMPASEKQAVMDRFRKGETQVLVTTTVIEVGVDVASATVMIIEDADRFGLSQLHQLRGRVGRGVMPSQVFLISASKQKDALARLSALETTDDGFELASFDLSLRREGDILGNRQSGASVLKLVNVIRDSDIVEAAHDDARAIFDADPELSAPEHVALGREVRMMFSRDHEEPVIGG